MMFRQAPGEEIVTIAYRNGLNIVKITESANWMIAEHVDRNQSKNYFKSF